MCPYCGRLLVVCPLGLGCPGSVPGHPDPCRRCFRGAVCPTHGPLWPRGHRDAVATSD